MLQMTYMSTDDTTPNVLPSSSSESDSSIQAYKGKVQPKAGYLLPPSDLQELMSNLMNATSPASKELNINGHTHHQVNVHHLCYSSSQLHPCLHQSLIDLGANGGISGSDVCIVSTSDCMANVQGIDNHQVADIPIVTARGVTNSKQGPILIILHQYVHVGKGKTIHSSIQLETFGNNMNDCSLMVSHSLQHIKTLDGHHIPLNIKAGLPYMTLRPFTDDEWDSLPHVVLTSDQTWDPTIADHTISNDDIWYDTHQDIDNNDSFDPPLHLSLFDDDSCYCNCHPIHFTSVTDDNIQHHLLPDSHFLYQVYNKELVTSDPDYISLIPNFGWIADSSCIEKMFNNTTQYAKVSHLLLSNVQGIFSCLKHTLSSGRPAINFSCTMAQFYCGTDSTVCNVYPMKTEKQFPNTLKDIIHHYGAPNCLISDQASVKTKGRAVDLLHTYIIGNWNSEPYMQHQNPAECCCQTIKHATNCLLDCSGSPGYTWLLAIIYVCFLLNHLASPNFIGILLWKLSQEGPLTSAVFFASISGNLCTIS